MVIIIRTTAIAIVFTDAVVIVGAVVLTVRNTIHPRRKLAAAAQCSNMEPRLAHAANALSKSLFTFPQQQHIKSEQGTALRGSAHVGNRAEHAGQALLAVIAACTGIVDIPRHHPGNKPHHHYQQQHIICLASHHDGHA